jgi:hypothetical protein
VGNRGVDLMWDLSRTRFPPSGFPELSSSYFFTIVVDDEMAVVVGDMAGKAYKKMKARLARLGLGVRSLYIRRG